MRLALGTYIFSGIKNPSPQDLRPYVPCVAAVLWFLAGVRLRSTFCSTAECYLLTVYWCVLFQLKMREQVAETQRNLPLRLRIFEKFPYVSVVCDNADTLGHFIFR